MGGRLLQGDPAQTVEHVSFDSRSMLGKDLFIPIRGEKVDGHRFIAGAMAAGAAASLTAEAEAEAPGPLILVKDTVLGLQRLASHLRREFEGPVVGITGSVGKTTTREMTMAALRAAGPVTGSLKNQNSQLGLPTTVCHMDYSAWAAVLEMGVSEPDEMERLVQVARPELALVTNIGVAHIQNLGSREGICREKMRITEHLGEKGTAVLCGDEPLLRAYQDKLLARTLYFGMDQKSDVYPENLMPEGLPAFTAVLKKSVLGETLKIPVRLSVPGSHNVMNALAALTAAAVLGVDPEKAAESLEGFSGFARRLEQAEVGGLRLIDDSYNASPVSMKAALEVLAAAPGSRRVALLADMLELGPDSRSMHREVGEFAADLPIDLYITLGEEIKALEGPLTEAGKTVMHAATREEAVTLIRAMTDPGDVLLLKGSNGMRLDLVRAALAD